MYCYAILYESLVINYYLGYNVSMRHPTTVHCFPVWLSSSQVLPSRYFLPGFPHGHYSVATHRSIMASYQASLGVHVLVRWIFLAVESTKLPKCTKPQLSTIYSSFTFDNLYESILTFGMDFSLQFVIMSLAYIF